MKNEKWIFIMNKTKQIDHVYLKFIHPTKKIFCGLWMVIQCKNACINCRQKHTFYLTDGTANKTS